MKQILELTDPATAKVALGKLLYTYRFSTRHDDSEVYAALNHLVTLTGQDRKSLAQNMLFHLIAEAATDKDIFRADTGIILVTTWLYNRK